MSKKGPKSSFFEHDKLEHHSIKGKRKEKKKPARSKKAGEEKEEKKEKKRVALIENNGDNTQDCTYQDANITRRVNLFIYFASYSVHN